MPQQNMGRFSHQKLTPPGHDLKIIENPHLAKSTIAAPSVTWLLLPAVVLPPALKASDVVVQCASSPSSGWNNP
jgi:hypothetical protein